MQKSDSLLSLSEVSALHSDKDDDDGSCSHGSLVFEDDTLSNSEHTGSIIAFEDTIDAGSLLLNSTTRFIDQSNLIDEEGDDTYQELNTSYDNVNSFQHQEEEEQLELGNSLFNCNQSDEEFSPSTQIIKFESPDELIVQLISKLVQAKKNKGCKTIVITVLCCWVDS